MACKIGKIEQNRTLAENVTETTIGTIVEKTQGNYIEVLFCLDDKYITENGNHIDAGGETSFDVHVGKTIDEVLSLYGVTNPTWTQALAEV